MSVVGGQKDYVAFVGGLNTEAGYLSFPENNWKDGDNVIPSIKGSVSRRKGIDFEQDWVWAKENLPDYYAIKMYMWKNVGGDGDRSIVVLQTGRMLSFYNYSTVATVLKPSPDYPVITLTRAVGNPSLDHSVMASFASDGSGLLLVTSSATEPCYIEYNVDTGSLTKKDITVQIRDLTGIDDGVAVDEHPSVLTPTHRYNLLNAGWTDALISEYKGDDVVVATAKANLNYNENDDTATGGVSAELTKGGTYPGLPNITITGGNGTGFKAEWTSELKQVVDGTLFGMGVKHITVRGTKYFLKTASPGAGYTVAPAITIENAPGAGGYPAKTQSWVNGKDPDDTFSRDVLDKIDFGTSAAATGRFILNVFSRNRNKSGITGIPVETETHRPRACCFFAGRAWYSGVKSNYIGTWVLFSQVALDPSKLGKCYQDADPTSEVITDLLESDGGYISLQGAGEILRMEALQDGVLVFATNGVWFIYGESNSGFSATGYRITKLTEFGCVGSNGVVPVDNGALYVGYSGIYAVTPNEQSGLPGIQSVTDTTIKTLVLDIPSLCKSFMQGSFNAGELSVMWVYSDDVDNPQLFNKALVLDNRLGSFYSYTFNKAVAIRGITSTPPNAQAGTRSTDVVAGGVEVVADEVPVVMLSSLREDNSSQWKLLASEATGTTMRLVASDFLQERPAPTRYRDWYKSNGAGYSYSSYLSTGHLLDPNGAAKAGQSMYVSAFMERTETAWLPDGVQDEGSCLLQAKWDFTDNAIANKWTAPMQIYRKRRWIGPFIGAHEDGYPLVITKNKVRGRGKALQLKFSSDGDKPFTLVGWSTTYLGGNNV